MSVDLNEIELGFVVSLGALREAIKELNVDGRRWWISRDPHDAAELGYVTIAHGCQGCMDWLNTLHFRVPVLGNDCSNRPDRTILIVDPSTATAEEPGYAPRQENAVKALNHLLDEDYWLQVAHANGVTKDKKVREALVLARVPRWNSIAVNRAPQATQITNLLGTACQVF